MIAIFSTLAEAQAYANKVHAYLQANRPNYHADRWAVPYESAEGGTWYVKAPVEEEVQKWAVPINTATEISKAIGITATLPDTGGLCEVGKYYQWKGAILKCRQTHNRTIYDPKDTPSLFSYFRDNSEQLEWITGEQVEVGWMRIYNGTKYEVVQAHQTQEDWTPTATIGTLWKIYVDPLSVSEWAVGVAYKVNDIVTYLGLTYKCLQAHTSQAGWFPSAVPALWQLQ